VKARQLIDDVNDQELLVRAHRLVLARGMGEQIPANDPVLAQLTQAVIQWMDEIQVPASERMRYLYFAILNNTSEHIRARLSRNPLEVVFYELLRTNLSLLWTAYAKQADFHEQRRLWRSAMHKIASVKRSGWQVWHCSPRYRDDSRMSASSDDCVAVIHPAFFPFIQTCQGAEQVTDERASNIMEPDAGELEGPDEPPFNETGDVAGGYLDDE